VASDAQLGFSQVPAWAAQAMLQNKPACVVYCRRTPTRLAGGKLLHSRSRFYESIWENSKNDIAAIRVTRPNRVKERDTTENIESG
jgi:hypothetical protein